MCFSPEASFTSGIILTGLGITTLKKVQVPSQTLFASIPLVFDIQQLSEGFVWLSLQDPSYAGVQQAGMYTFLTAARVVWPTLMPLAVLKMEVDVKKKQLLRLFVGLGLTVSVYYSYCLLILHVEPNIAGHHVQYISNFPDSLAVPAFLIYFIASIPPLFISSMKRTRLLGALLFLSSSVTAIFYFEYLTSVWCFFAAIVSVVILWILRREKD
jgi:hypothetical protein